MNRKHILEEMEELLRTYCHGCFVYKYNRQDYGRLAAHKFCISKCTIGEKIKAFGKKL